MRAAIPAAALLILATSSCSGLEPAPQSWTVPGEEAKALLEGLGDFDTVKAQFEADPSMVLNSGWLHQMSRFTNPEATRWLLERGMDPDLEAMGFGRPMHAAVNTAGANNEAAELLWLFGAEPNPSTRSRMAPFAGQTPLHVAAMFHQVEMVSMLLERGADPNLRWDQSTPLHTAMRSGASPAHQWNGRTTARLLVEAGADLNAVDDDGFTPLHGAAGFGDQQEALRYLLDKGADPNLGCPLAAAARFAHPENVRMLLAAGADSNCLDQRESSALVLAVESGQLGIVRDLVAAGASVLHHRKPSEPWNDTTPLHKAASRGDAELVAILLKANPNLDDTVSMQTVIHVAAGAEHARCPDERPACGRPDLVVRLLLEAGANPNLVDGSGDTPLDDASSPAVEQVLREYGAKVSNDLPIAERRGRIKQLERDKAPGPASPPGLRRR